VVIAPQLLSPRRQDASDFDVEEGRDAQKTVNNDLLAAPAPNDNLEQLPSGDTPVLRTTTIAFDPSIDQRRDSMTLHIPGPQERDRGLFIPCQGLCTRRRY
jgi:hypothetical protein